MIPLQPGQRASEIPGATVDDERPTAVAFYKVTCPTCQLAAPAMERLASATAPRFVAVVQDPPEAAEDFARNFGVGFASVPDLRPFAISDSYGIRTVPTVFALEGGVVADVVESWDREGWNRVAERLGVGPVSHEGDGLPPFRPG